MSKYLYIISAFLMILSYTIPIHFYPWPCIQSIFLAIISCSILALNLSKKSKIQIPKFSIFILLVAILPWIQYFFNIIFYYNTTFIVSMIILIFWVSFIVGFNLSNTNDAVLKYLSIIFLISSLISSFLAIFQWLNIDISILLMSELHGNRPYANINQPNQLATLQVLGLLSILYFYENKRINKYLAVFISIIILFSIVLTQSRTAWIMFFSFSSLFLFSKLEFKISKIYVLSFNILFLIFVYSLPTINQFISNYHAVTSTTDVLTRVTTGYLRLDIWKQMTAAILKNPFMGYGWFQTSAAQFQVIDKVHGTEWISSSHNFFLDLIVWNGIPLGLIFIIFIITYFVRPLFSIPKVSYFIASMMILSIMIHSMLEYPIFYTFFSIPLALLLGSVWNQKGCRKLIECNGILFLLPFSITLIFSYIFFTQYNNVSTNITLANLYVDRNNNEYKLAKKTPIFDNFEARAKWFALNPRKSISDEKLREVREVVSLYLTEYDLKKYSILLKYNDKEEESKRVLTILKVMYNIDVNYSDLT